MTQKYQIGDEFTITEVPFDKEQDIEHSYPAKLVSIEKGVYKLEAHNNCCFYMDEHLKPIDRVDAYGRVDSLAGFLCSFVSHIKITPKPKNEEKEISDSVAQGVGELGLDMHVIRSDKPVADATQYGVLTERTYRPRGTIRAVKADPKKFEMINKWSGENILVYDENTWGVGLSNRVLFQCIDLRDTQGWYICKDEAGHVWPVRDDIFEKTYEEIL